MDSNLFGYRWTSLPMSELTKDSLQRIKNDIQSLIPQHADPEVFIMFRTEKNINEDRATVLNAASAIIINDNTYGSSGSKGTPPGGNSL